MVVKYIRSDDGGAQHKDWNHYGAMHKLDLNMNLPESGWIEYEVILGEYDSNKDGNGIVMLETCSGWSVEDTS
ncbi:hypothetical protein ACFWBB_09550 [Streptomyces sp. NPDC060000]|uniref:hypothetical protein n=1 Tax=Streptomyces sp. NPDC060000 TaxID=3347031 RepID=UPI003676DE27